MSHNTPKLRRGYRCSTAPCDVSVRRTICDRAHIRNPGRIRLKSLRLGTASQCWRSIRCALNQPASASCHVLGDGETCWIELLRRPPSGLNATSRVLHLGLCALTFNCLKPTSGLPILYTEASVGVVSATVSRPLRPGLGPNNRHRYGEAVA